MREDEKQKVGEGSRESGIPNSEIINEEVLRAKIKQIIGEPKPPSRFQRITTNPLVPIILGFVLTGLVGTLLTNYYTVKQKELEFELSAKQRDREREKDERQKELEFEKNRQLRELEREKDERQKEREREKDERQKAIEYERTKHDRETERLRQERQKEIDYQRAQQNIVAQRTIDQARALDQFMKYMSSEKPEEREFGYQMFATLGYEKLAATMIGFRKDLAGKEVLVSLTKNPDNSVRQLAQKELLKISEIETQRIEAITDVFETGGKGQFNEIDEFLRYKDIRHAPSLPSIIESYTETVDAQYRRDFVPYLTRLANADKTLAQDDRFIELLGKAKNDPVMRNVQKQLRRHRFFDSSLKTASAMGIKTLLGLAIIYDSFVLFGKGNFEKARTQVSQELNGTPLSGVDEKLWIKTYLMNRRSYYSRNTSLAWVVSRLDFYIGLAEKGNWDLAPPLTVRGTTVQ